MATVRHLGLFSLPNIALGSVDQFSRGANRCVQPASDFATTTLDGVSRNIAPASLAQSTYTEVSFDRAMLWLWRIKTFTVSATLTVEIEDEDYSLEINVNPFIAQNLKFNFLSNPIADEKEKACDCGMFFGLGESDGFEDNENGSYQVRVLIAAVQSMWANYPNTPPTNIGSIGQRLRHNSENESWYIPVYVEVNLNTDFGSFLLSSSSTTVSSAGSDKKIKWQISDRLGSLSRPFRFGENVVSGDINITATEYWPFDPGDGLGPIYDSVTGEQLREFPS
jgi:hypothetical protein